MSILLGGGAVWALTWEPQLCGLFLGASQLGERIHAMHWLWGGTQSHLKVASHMVFIPAPGEKTIDSCYIQRVLRARMGYFVGARPPTLSGVTSFIHRWETGAQRRWRQVVVIVTLKVPSGDWSMKGPQCKEAGRTSQVPLDSLLEPSLPEGSQEESRDMNQT